METAGASLAVTLTPREDLFEDQTLRAIQNRALAYLRAGLHVHLRGQAGTGKTTLALDIAARLGRPVILIAGDNWFTSANLLGRETGSKTRQVLDRYVHSVQKLDATTSAVWTDEALTEAVATGCTLVYDEFTRSPPAANNPLLMALEERMLVLPSGPNRARTVAAHPEFRAIFTSNPEDYVAVNRAQDALLDRMVSFDLDGFGRETELGIVAMRSGWSAEQAAPAVDLVRGLRQSGALRATASMRGAIMICKVCAAEAITPALSDPRYLQLCQDVLMPREAESRAIFVREFSRWIGGAQSLQAGQPPAGTAAKSTLPRKAGGRA
jgi:nitric oxide reductase NorQ protein